MEGFRRYIPTDFETELCPSVLITDGIFQSVIPLLFSGFLVVEYDLVKKSAICKEEETKGKVMVSCLR